MSNRISGTVDRVFFTSAKFSAGALVRDDGDRVRFRGPFCVSEGELVTLTGQWKSDPKYGPQFDAKSVSYDLPETPEGLVQYLAKHPAFTNWWKSFINARLRVSMGDRGCLSLFGTNAETHRMLSEHLTSEYFIKTEARGRSVDEWKQRPEQPDNHWFDCLVGSAVAASMQGVILPGIEGKAEVRKERMSFTEMQMRRRSK